MNNIKPTAFSTIYLIHIITIGLTLVPLFNIINNMSKVYIDINPNSKVFISPSKEVEASVGGYVDTGETFTSRDLRLSLSRGNASNTLSTMKCIELVKKGRPNVYRRTFDPQEIEDPFWNPVCNNCGHHRRVPICAILLHAAR